MMTIRGGFLAEMDFCGLWPWVPGVGLKKAMNFFLTINFAHRSGV